MCQVCRVLGFAFQSDAYEPGETRKGSIWALSNSFLGLDFDFTGFSRHRTVKCSASADKALLLVVESTQASYNSFFHGVLDGLVVQQRCNHSTPERTTKSRSRMRR
eukprot:6213633-Pleurochrysis_carterae.AAC.1